MGRYSFLKSNVDAIVKDIRKEGNRRKRAMAKVLLAAIREGMDRPKSGWTYRIPGTDKTYTASAPGEYPAVRTGALRKSIRTRTRKNKLAVGSDLRYARMVNAARPFLADAIERAEPQLERIVSEPWSI